MRLLHSTIGRHSPKKLEPEIELMANVKLLANGT